ncbi:MAG: hypothetical protein ABIR48_08405 [Gammaproteobacteria bacterium]
MEPTNTQTFSSNSPAAGSLPVTNAAQDSKDRPGMSDIARDAKQKAQGSTKRLAAQVRHQATSMVENKKTQIAGHVSSFADAVRKTAEHLGDQHGGIAQYVHSFARNLDDMADGLQSKDISELLAQTKDFARRRPAIFVGGAVAAGFLLARFLKSSDEHSRPGSDSSGSDYYRRD